MNDASVTTREKVIQIKYKRLVDSLAPLFPPEKQVFPNLEEYDLVDVLFYFSLLFVYAEDDYKGNLRTLLMTQGVTLDEATFDQVHAIVLPFILFLKKTSL